MNISFIGAGYVGLVTGACLAELGMNVICVDKDEEKIANLNNEIIPIYEPGLEEIVKRNALLGRLRFTTKIKEAVHNSEVIFLTVNTPTLQDDSTDLSFVFRAVTEIAENMDSYRVIVNKSTVPVGTGRKIKNIVKKVFARRGLETAFDIVSNPEFLREGSAVPDCIQPDRIVIGADSERAISLMKEIYNVQLLMGIPLISTNIETAEMIKYASNTFLATKVSFINEIANMCDLCGADVTVVSKAMGLDKRIGPKFLNPGPGYGGSCFPKDTRAFVGIGRRLGYTPKIVKSTIRVNYDQSKLMVRKIKKALGELQNKVITVLGLSFKPGTDDIRESPAIPIIKALLEGMAKVKVYDPKAMENTKRALGDLNIIYSKDVYTACENSDCIVLITEWDDFKNLDFEILKLNVNTPVFIDLRNVYDPQYVKSCGFSYQGVGRQ
ncbi:MAG: UDP-glucose/GDP-mannose dehydrogenase family protein [Clostridia bacterium]|nr:UDP-glucose/GDP-mannose dehydrogenase family protein [Clostridia bacterium]